MMRIGLKTLAFAALALLCLLQALAVLRTPPAWLPASIDVSLPPRGDMLLGRLELAAPQAGQRHLRLRRDAAGAWFAASADGVQGLRFERGVDRIRSGALALRAGQQFQLGAVRYRVNAAGSKAVAFSDGLHDWRYDGASVRRDGAALGACPGAAPGARLLGLWNRWAPAALTVKRALRFGGNLSCGTQIGNADAPAGSTQLSIEDGVPLLTAAASLERVPLLVTEAGLPRDLALAEQPLAGLTAMTVGRTRMLASVDGDVLRLQPTQRVALFAKPTVQLPDGVRWHWEQRAAWAWPASLSWWLFGAVAAGLLAALLAGRTRYRKELRDLPACARLGACVALAIAGLGLLLAQRAGGAPGVIPSLLLAWAALWTTIATKADGSAGAVMSFGVLLLAAGLLLQLELGIGAPDTSWLRHFQKTAAVSTLGLGLVGLAALLKGAKPPAQAGVETLLLLLAGAALAALLLQVGWGNETGVFDLQPVEFAKLALTVLSAHCVALGLGAAEVGDQARGGALLRWLRLASPALLFILLLAVALVQVDDYSPLILLLVWGAAMLLAWSCAAKKAAPAFAVLSLAGSCLLALTVLRGAAPGEVAQWSFYGERFGVWLDPAAHPHTGQQLLLGAQAITKGGWFGADGLFGLQALGGAALEAVAIPAVQDDFTPSFLLQRHGLASGLMLWALQALFLGALLQAAWRAWQTGSTARDYRQAWLGRFRSFVLCGGAAFVFGHFLLSWGTNLAFFPIMGQPMSFLSAGGSHLLFFIFPLLAFCAAGAPSIEENPSCRSTSNTKP